MWKFEHHLGSQHLVLAVVPRVLQVAKLSLASFLLNSGEGGDCSNASPELIASQ